MADSPTTLLAWLTAELDKALAAQPAENKRQFLYYAFERWQGRYDHFRTVGADYAPHPVYGAPTAVDFLGILGAITTRRDALFDDTVERVREAMA